MGVVASLQEELSLGIASEATKTSGQLRGHQQIKELPVRELSPSSCSSAPSFLPLTSLCSKALDIPGFGHG